MSEKTKNDLVRVGGLFVIRIVWFLFRTLGMLVYSGQFGYTTGTFS